MASLPPISSGRYIGETRGGYDPGGRKPAFHAAVDQRRLWRQALQTQPRGGQGYAGSSPACGTSTVNRRDGAAD